MAWQATTMIASAILVGLPAGVVLGRWAWTLMADGLGVERLRAASLTSLGVGVAGLILAANIVALIPARTAARTHPALVLRTE